MCHLIQAQGQKKSLNEIKASLKQAVHIPLDFVGLGIQLQLFMAVSSIFFGKESVCTDKLKYLLLLVGCNKKSFCSQIALDDFFATNSSLQLIGEFKGGSECVSRRASLALKLMTMNSTLTTY